MIVADSFLLTIILMLLVFILGLIFGVSLAKPDGGK